MKRIEELKILIESLKSQVKNTACTLYESDEQDNHLIINSLKEKIKILEDYEFEFNEQVYGSRLA